MGRHGILRGGWWAGAGLVFLLVGTPVGADAYEVWVTNQGLNKVQVIDGDSLKIIGEISAGTKPHNVTFSRDFKRAYVANVGSNNVTVIDATTRQAVKTVPAGKTAHHVAVSPDDRLLLVSNPGEHTVMLFDATSLDLLKTIPVGKGPAMAVFTSDGKRAYVSNGGDATVSIVDVAKREVVKTIPGVGQGAMGMVLTLDGKASVVTGGGKTSVIDTATDAVVAEVLTGKDPHGAALTEDGRLVLIADRQSDAVSLVDSKTWKVVATVANVERPDIIDVFGGRGFITTRGQAVTGDPHALSGKNPALVVIDLQRRQVHATVPLGGDPHGVAVRR